MDQKENRKAEFKALIDSGMSQSEIAVHLGISRQRVSSLILNFELREHYKKKNPPKEYRCRECNIKIPCGRVFCDEHKPQSKDTYPCKECGKPTEPGNRSKGMCMTCYRKKYIDKPGNCDICGKKKTKMQMVGVCVRCYMTARYRAINNVQPDEWRKKTKYHDREVELWKKMY